MRSKIEDLAAQAVGAVKDACREYEVEIKDEGMAKIMNASVISPPKLEFNGRLVETTTRDSAGNYRLSNQFYKAMSISNWRIVTLDRCRAGDQNANAVVTMLQKEGSAL